MGGRLLHDVIWSNLSNHTHTNTRQWLSILNKKNYKYRPNSTALLYRKNIWNGYQTFSYSSFIPYGIYSPSPMFTFLMCKFNHVCHVEFEMSCSFSLHCTPLNHLLSEPIRSLSGGQTDVRQLCPLLTLLATFEALNVTRFPRDCRLNKSLVYLPPMSVICFPVLPLLHSGP